MKNYKRIKCPNIKFSDQKIVNIFNECFLKGIQTVFEKVFNILNDQGNAN